MIPLVPAQLARQSGEVVEGSRSEEEGLHKAGDGREYRRHAVDALPPIAVGIAEGASLLLQGVEERGIKRAYILPAEALQDEDHHIERSEGAVGCTLMQRRIIALGLRLGQVIGHPETSFAQRTEERKGGIEHHSGIQRPTYILVGIAQRDGTGSGRHAPSHPEHDPGSHTHQGQGLRQVIVPTDSRLLACRCPEGSIEQPAQEEECEGQIPMVQGFMQEYRSQVAACLMGKLVPYAHGGPTAGIGEIDAIDQIRQEKQ